MSTCSVFCRLGNLETRQRHALPRRRVGAVRQRSLNAANSHQPKVGGNGWIIGFIPCIKPNREVLSCVCVSGDDGLRPDRLQQSPLSETRLLTAPPCRSAKKHFAERPVGIHKLYPIGQRKSYSVFHCLFGVFSAHHSRIWSVLRTSSNCNSRTRSQRSLPRSHLKRRFINCYLSGSQYLQGFASI